MKIISLIIPVYNVEKYLRKCLDSIYEQDFEENKYEVIIVIDGSPDNSITIAKEYKIKHSNITILEQNNQGLSSARNVGLSIAKGEYIWFIDSDDCIALNSLMHIESIITNKKPDMIGFNIIKIKHQNGEISQEVENVIIDNNSSNLYNTIDTGINWYRKIHTGAVPRYLFKKSFLNKYNLIFYPQIYHEDIEFLVKAIVLASNITLVNENFYYYIFREGSITSSFKIKSIYDYLIIIDNWKVFAANSKLSCKQKAAIYDAIYLRVSYILSIKTDNKEFICFYNKNKNYLKQMVVSSSFLSIKYYHSLGKIIKTMLININPSLIK